MTESEAVALVRMLWNLWGEERIAEQMGQDTLDRFKRVLGFRETDANICRRSG